MKTNRSILIGALTLIVLSIFALKAYFFISAQKILSFDTFRDISYARHIVETGSLSKPSEFGLSLLLGVLSLNAPVSVEAFAIIFGYATLFLSAILCFCIVYRLEKSYVLSFFTSFLLLFSPLIVFNADNFRPEMFSYLMQFTMLFLILLAFTYKKTIYLYASYIPFIFLFFTHKTGKLMPIVALGALGCYFLLNFKEDRFSKVQYYVVFFLLLLVPFYKEYLNFINFYLLGKGQTVSPQGFNLPLENPLGFFSLYGEFISFLFALAFIGILLNLLFRKMDYRLAFYGLVSACALMFYSFIVITPRILGVSILPTRFYPYLFIYGLLIMPFILKEIKTVPRNWFTVIFIALILTSYFPTSYTEDLRVTGSLSYVKELDRVDFQTGDVIITTFTSSPPILNAVLSKSKYDQSIQVVSGYNFWGEAQMVMNDVRRVYLLQNTTTLSRAICTAIESQVEYLQKLPEAEDFLVPDAEEKVKMIDTLKHPQRILMVNPLFDLKNRHIPPGTDDDKIKWWQYRSVTNMNKKLFTNEEFREVYESENIEVYDVDVSCDTGEEQ